jgi:hypothetical protein
MQISTILSLAGTVTCVGLFAKQKDWLLTAAFAFATAHTLLAVFRPSFIPGYLVPWCAYAFFALAAIEFVRKVVLK